MFNDIKYYFLLHGHNTKNNDFALDVDLANYIEYLIDNKEEDIKSNVLRKMEIKNIIDSSSSYLNSIFNIHKVGFLNDKILINRLNGKEILSVEEAIKLYNNAGIMISPFLLPIRYNNWYDNYGCLIIASPLIDEEIITKNINIFFEGIILNNNCNEKSIPIYIHEIIHTQLESNKGSIIDIKIER